MHGGAGCAGIHSMLGTGCAYSVQPEAVGARREVGGIGWRAGGWRRVEGRGLEEGGLGAGHWRKADEGQQVQ